MIRSFATPWFGRERRSNAALHRLGRQLYNLCRNAADPFELAAQLESLGYNRYRVEREFGLRTTFDLAERLFALTPRRPRLAVVHHSVASPLGWQLATFAQLALSLLAYWLFGVSPNYLELVWLLPWTLGGTYVLKQLETADLNTKKRSFTLLLLVGLVGGAGTFYFSKPSALEATLGLLWWQLPVTFWLNAFVPPQRLRHYVAGILAGFIFFMPPLADFALVFLAALLLFAPFLARPKASTFQYLLSRLHFFVLPALLGLGQSLLLLQIFPSTAHPLAGFILIVVTVFASSWFGTSFKRSVATALWKAKSSEAFQARVFRSLGFIGRIFIIVAFLGLLVALNLLLPFYSVTLLPFMLLALAISLSLLLYSFNDVFLPSTAFIIASLLVLTGFSFIPVVTALTAILGIGVVLYITRVERYGVDLL
jgi:hypothetical protein